MIDYADEKLTNTVVTLAATAGSWQERLADAFESHLHRLNPDDDLPEAQRETFRRIAARLTRGETIQASALELSDAEAGELAERIVEMAFAVCGDAARSEV